MMETVAGRYQPVMLVKPQEQEDLDDGYTSMDDMDGLSDSQSTLFSNSRPTTPSDDSARPHPRISKSHRGRANTADSESELPHFAVASKASLILGLVPGTLSHAMACLENARDEARRLFDVTPMSNHAACPAMGGEAKKAGGRMDRARKAMSIALPSTGSLAKLAGMAPGVMLDVGGKEEEMQRERRRKVADGVLHWQKAVQRLREVEEVEVMKQQKEMGAKTGTRKGRR